VHGWHRFLAVEGASTLDPSREVRPPARPRRLPKALAVEDVVRLLDAAGRGDGPVPLRDRALLELLYSTGARISEVIGLDVDDLDRETAEVLLRGKGAKERVVPVGSFAIAAVEAYLVRARPELAGHGSGTPALFLNSLGRRLSRQSGWAVLRLAAERAGVRGDISPPGAARPCLGDHHADLHTGQPRPAARGLRLRPSPRPRVTEPASQSRRSQARAAVTFGA